MRRRSPHILLYVLLLSFLNVSWCRADLQDDALLAAKRAVVFLTEQVSTRGGYLWRYSHDLTLREGEGVVTNETIWIQPPGTPSVGEAFVALYEATGEPQFLDAAMAAAEALRLGQMRSGGWQAMIEFEPNRRQKWAYRVDPPRKQAKDQSSLDDDKTQSAIRFLIKLDRATQFRDAKVHAMATDALDGLLNRGQFGNGGFPQIWTSERRDSPHQDQRANYPETWPREYQGHREYWYRYTLNDNLAPTVMKTLFLAADVYTDTRYEAAARKLADFLLLAQLPAPQPAWAQQYNWEMQPMWARKFEPPAITGGESQGVIETLMSVYRRTGDKKYLEPIPKALDYLERSQLPDGRLARFYELKTNRPLYFTREYQLTYDDTDLPTHYAFRVASRVPQLRKEYQDLVASPQSSLNREEAAGIKVDLDRIRRILAAQDNRGAWVTNRGLRYHNDPGPTIEMAVAVQNLHQLALYLKSQSTAKLSGS